MKTTISQSAFIDAFRRYDRYEQFGYDALCSLFDYMEQMEQDTGEEIELDVIALCCDYSVDSVEDIASSYSIDIEGMDDDEAREAVLDYLNDNTTVIDEDCNGQILYCSAF
jgi:hypothetical protein